MWYESIEYHYDSLYDQEMLMDRIEKEMHNQRSIALKKLSSIVAHSKTEILSRIIAHAYFESCEHALNLANDLDLCKLDFLAINECLDEFKDEFLKNYEEAQNF